MKKTFSLLTLFLITGLSVNNQLINKTNLDSVTNINSFNHLKTKIKPSDLDSKVTYQALNQEKTWVSKDLISSKGSTKDCPIITSKAKDNVSENLSAVKISIAAEINRDKSYYVFGLIDEDNNFKTLGQQNFINQNIINILGDGIYHLHLTDLSGIEYDSYVELGFNNWQIQGTFNSGDFNVLSSLLNVKMPTFSETKYESAAFQWLRDYQKNIDSVFNAAVNDYGRGFDIQVISLTQGYKSFLVPINYVDSNTKKSINQVKLKTEINEYVLNLINSLEAISKKLNVDWINIVDRFTFEQYYEWIHKYNTYLNNNRFELISDEINLATREYARDEQKKEIFRNLVDIQSNEYLKFVIWDKSFQGNFNQYIDYEKLQELVINIMNNLYPEISASYEQDMQTAESNLNLHGYTITRLLEGQQPAQTKSEIANYQNDLSFHNWLQQKADDWFHDWQLKMGLGIGVPLFAILVASGGAYWRHHYNKYAACGWRKKLRPIGWEPSRRVSLSFNFWDAPKKKRYPFKEADDVLSGKEQVKSETNEIDKAETKENQNLKEKQFNQENEKN